MQAFARSTLLTVLLLLILCVHTVRAQEGRIFGVIADSVTGQRIPFANVVILETHRGVASNDYGFYMIPGLPPGSYEIAASAVGYTRATRKVSLGRNQSLELNFRLAPRPIESGEVEVIGSRKSELMERSISTHVLDSKELKLSPVAGQQDVLQSLKLLPGFVSTSDVSSKFFVRGGASDQNLFLLDGIKIYSPFHALGLFSVFDPDMVDNVEVYTGAFPAQFGGRLSSVVSIKTRDGRADRISGEADANFLSVKSGLEGPMFANSSWSVNARKSISSHTFGNIIGEKVPASFYDATVKLSMKPEGPGKIDITYITSNDVLNATSPKDPTYAWQNNGFALSGSKLLGEKTFLSAHLFMSSYSARRDPTPSGNVTPASTSVKEFGLRTSGTVYDTPDDNYYFGFDFSFPSLDYSFVNRFNQPLDIQSQQPEVSIWAGYRAAMGALQLDAGIHTDIGSLFEGRDPLREIQPRISLTYLWFGNWRLKASFGRFTQKTLTVTNEDDVISIFDGWIRVPENIHPEQADHYVVGIGGNVTERTSVNLEAYYKRYNALVVYNRDKFDPNDPDYIEGTGNSYGSEFIVRSRVMSIDLYGTYSLSWARINNAGFEYYPRYDRRHHLNLMSVIHPMKRLDLVLRMEYGSGFPFTQTIGYLDRLTLDNALPGPFELETGTPYQMLGAKNAARLPAYHRLDLGLVYTLNFYGVDVKAGADILNVYDQKNIFYIDRTTGQRVNMIPFYFSATLAIKF
jgi:hypothetical protein